MMRRRIHKANSKARRKLVLLAVQLLAALVIVSLGHSQGGVVPYHDPEWCGQVADGERKCSSCVCIGDDCAVYGRVCDEFEYVLYEETFERPTCQEAFDACEEWEEGGA